MTTIDVDPSAESSARVVDIGAEALGEELARLLTAPAAALDGSADGSRGR